MITENPYGRILGYARVSTDRQNLSRQLDSLEDYGVAKEDIYTEKESGKDFNRPVYKKLIRLLRRGDILVIKSIDRLGRSYQDIIDQWRLITQDIGAGIHVIDMPLLNTSGDPEDLLSRFITDMMLQVLSFVAQNERENTLKRQKEGIAAARRRGVKMGRPRTTIPLEFWEVFVKWKNRTVPVKELKKYSKEKYGICTRTFYRRIRELDCQFSDVPPEELATLDLTPYKDGFEYLTEMEEAAQGYYNPYTNNTEKELSTQKARKEKIAMEREEFYAQEESQIRAMIREKRQEEFRKRFGIPDPKPRMGGEPPKMTIPIDLDNEVVKTVVITD